MRKIIERVIWGASFAIALIGTQLLVDNSTIADDGYLMMSLSFIVIFFVVNLVSSVAYVLIYKLAGKKLPPR